MFEEPLAVHPCRRQCCWRPTPRQRAGEALFACTSCGSEWVPSQPWTPVDQDGTRHESLTRAIEEHPPT